MKPKMVVIGFVCKDQNFPFWVSNFQSKIRQLFARKSENDDFSEDRRMKIYSDTVRKIVTFSKFRASFGLWFVKFQT